MKMMIMGLWLLAACEQPTDVADRPRKIPTLTFNWTLHHLTDGVSEKLAGPGGQLQLEYAGDTVKVVNPKGNSVALEVIPPASILWRPDGKAVAINNGNGSGQTSELLIVASDESVSILDKVAGVLKAYFLERNGCSVAMASISITAHGWSTDGSKIWTSLESWDRERRCKSSDVYFAQYDFSRQAVTDYMSSDETMARLCADLGFRQQFEPNCLQYENKIQ